MIEKGKAIVAALYAAATVAIPLFTGGKGPGDLSPSEWVTILIGVATAGAVYLVPLVPQFPGVKTAVAALLAGLQVLVQVIDGGISGNDVLTIVVAVAGVLGIYLAPAASVTGTRVGWGSDRVIT